MMSGTSLDGVDVALICTDGVTVTQTGPWLTVPYEASVRRAIDQATDDSLAWKFCGPEPDSFELAERELTLAHASAVEQLLACDGVPVPVLIGFHGQTVFHRAPRGAVVGASCQLGDARLLARQLSCPVVYDFRSADMAAGGHGAPLAPCYHVSFLASLFPGVSAVALNIGGVANITFRSASGDRIIAFDTGPGNGPIDAWIQRAGIGRYDVDGQVAAAGRVDEGRLGSILSDGYFARVPPKSVDKSEFPASLADGLSIQDGAATLTALAARSILQGIDRWLPCRPEVVVVTGGGVHNPVLMGWLRSALGEVLVESLPGIRPDAIEAEAFAYLAVRSVRGLPISFPGTTGVPVPLTGGVVVKPDG